MRTRVKICGITRYEDAKLAVELGADALGFNFYGGSPRYISPQRAREIVCDLPAFVTKVGVFADEIEVARIVQIAEEAGVHTVQLHGPRFPPVDSLGQFTVIRALAIGEESAELQLPVIADQMQNTLRRLAAFESGNLSGSQVSAVLLDTHDPVLRGGTGRSFNWKIARYLEQFGPIILAGGLTPDNVTEAIKEVRPYAVDVATGVEVSPGIKDPGKLRSFFAAVRKADPDA